MSLYFLENKGIPTSSPVASDIGEMSVLLSARPPAKQECYLDLQNAVNAIARQPISRQRAEADRQASAIMKKFPLYRAFSFNMLSNLKKAYTVEGKNYISILENSFKRKIEEGKPAALEKADILIRTLFDLDTIRPETFQRFSRILSENYPFQDQNIIAHLNITIQYNASFENPPQLKKLLQAYRFQFENLP